MLVVVMSLFFYGSLNAFPDKEAIRESGRATVDLMKAAAIWDETAMKMAISDNAEIPESILIQALKRRRWEFADFLLQEGAVPAEEFEKLTRKDRLVKAWYSPYQRCGSFI